MTQEEKEIYIGRKVGFFWRDNRRLTVEGVINDIQSFGMLIEVTKSIGNEFYTVGEEYLIPFNAANFVYKFL